MIRSRFAIDRSAGLVLLDMDGHAGFADPGSDPVCAGASTLAFTAFDFLLRMEQEGAMRGEMQMTVDSGRMRLLAELRPERFDEALHALAFVATGMSLLAGCYPEHVARPEVAGELISQLR
ncbi:MAG: ribosomal-processing cysteine protease Prp [Oscillospiraceae bacterium]|nr:ribosomal-processing cysteine protease Prp [Oscillospiraceae bacterium]